MHLCHIEEPKKHEMRFYLVTLIFKKNIYHKKFKNVMLLWYIWC